MILELVVCQGPLLNSFSQIVLFGTVIDLLSVKDKFSHYRMEEIQLPPYEHMMGNYSKLALVRVICLKTCLSFIYNF